MSSICTGLHGAPVGVEVEAHDRSFVSDAATGCSPCTPGAAAASCDAWRTSLLPCACHSPPPTSSTGRRPSTADRVGVVDEPTQPAPSLGDVTYGDAGRPRPGDRGRARRARGRRGGAGRRRLGELGAAARADPRGHRGRPGLRAGQLPAAAGRGRVHRRAFGRVGAAARPGARRAAQPPLGQAPVRLRRAVRAGAAAPGPGAAAVVGSRTRTRPRRSTTRPGRRPGPRACS